MQLIDFIAERAGKTVAEVLDRVSLADDGEGPYIARWDASLGTKPTKTQIAAALEADMPLDRVKQQLKASIDAAAEAERQKYLTPGEGQAMTYQEKSKEVAAYRADPAPQESDYPFLMAGIGVNGSTLVEVVKTVEDRRAAWVTLGAGIERARELAKLAVDEATTEAAARAAADVTWPNAMA